MKLIAITSRFLPGNLAGFCHDNNIKTIILNQDHFSIASKWILISKLLADSVKLLGHLRELRKPDVLISVSYISVPLLIFRKLGLLKTRTSIIWEGFFLHNTKFFPIFKRMFQLLFRQDDSLLVYSEFEKDLYSRAFNLNLSNIHFTPLVFEPRPDQKLYNQYTKRIDWTKIPTDYYFSGGYSHRDYMSLLEAFKGLKSTLVICSSQLNSELKYSSIYDNIIVLNDVAREDFAELVRRSKACLLTIKSNSGAAGQLFAIEVMFYGKIIIASSTDILKEMISHRENGFLINNPILEIPDIINEIEDIKNDFTLLQKKARERVLTVNTCINFNKHIDTALKSVIKHNKQLVVSPE